MGAREVESSHFLPVNLQSGFGSSQLRPEPDGAAQSQRRGLFEQRRRRIYDQLILSPHRPQRTGIDVLAFITTRRSVTCASLMFLFYRRAGLRYTYSAFNTDTTGTRDAGWI